MKEKRIKEDRITPCTEHTVSKGEIIDRIRVSLEEDKKKVAAIFSMDDVDTLIDCLENPPCEGDRAWFDYRRALRLSKDLKQLKRAVGE